MLAPCIRPGRDSCTEQLCRGYAIIASLIRRRKTPFYMRREIILIKITYLYQASASSAILAMFKAMPTVVAVSKVVKNIIYNIE